MKFILFISLLILSFSAKSQFVNGVHLNDMDVNYIEIVGTSKLLSSKVTIQLEFGQRVRFFRGKEASLVDSTGNEIVLNSMIDALNYLSEYNFEFVTAYAVTMGNNQNVYHYLLRKKKK